MTSDVRARRVERAQKLLNRIKNEDKSKIRLFIDENIFTTDAAINRPNSRYPTDLPVHDMDELVRVSTHTKTPGKVMGLGFRSFPQFFIAAGERLNAAAFQELLRAHVVPWPKTTYPRSI